MTIPDLARRLWCTLASVPVAFPPTGVTVTVAPASRLCPPGWCGVVALGPFLGPAALAYLDPADFTPPAAIATSVPLSDPGVRDLARAVAGHAVADALHEGLVPQWRARPVESRRVARALGFRELGAQLRFEVS